MCCPLTLTGLKSPSTCANCWKPLLRIACVVLQPTRLTLRSLRCIAGRRSPESSLLEPVQTGSSQFGAADSRPEGAGAPWGGPTPRRTDHGVNRILLDELAAIWLVSAADRSQDAQQVAQWDEAFHCTLVAAAGNAEMARVHRDVTDRIRLIRRQESSKQPRIDATYDEHSKILQAILQKRGDQAALLLRAHIQSSQTEVRKITRHQVHLARQTLR